ncbi:uncharacterized protein zgc:174888 isoform X1 [Esox lucius]|uniref:Uncharacterized protein n=1 Tax=Esox lucius TaxID=8010 RepID=A0AAY5K0Z4_ESOLU|nr:uncharacterized protein zgc:174888 isoform X1 [Esox lucius]
MSPSVLLLLSILTVQGSGCEDFLKGVVESLKSTIDKEHAGFREMFPKDYWISHHYSDNLLCNTDPCCVFQAAAVLSDSWAQLRRQLWPEHHSFKLISDLIHALDYRGITKNIFEDPDVSILPYFSSSPEKLLNFTSSVFSRWLEMECSTPVDTCSLPTLSPPVQVEQPEKHKLFITTRAIHRRPSENEGETGMRLYYTQPPINGCPASTQLLGFVWSLLFFCGLNWILL